MVGFFEAYALFFKKYFQLHGKSTRSEYWWVFLINIIIRFIISIIIFTIYSAITGADDLLFSLFYVIIGLCIYQFLIFIPSINLIIRRYRDTGISAWWFVLTNILPFLITVIITFENNFASYLSPIVSLLLIADFVIKLLPSKK
ncbi:DUF805 domain-containing protein [Apilactobacillus apisilvae]|uniref:DUF805 domain-containing protein n=1 Tax=Apilactobacillus apisilvae TaxID=2923364 RepID=A0ABY4PGZ9_9LACO|nr:DUF805 domain-containing protein [Apilactobacillus apisilvae]UQS84877.1 DUF805 domain-containing protein [Apilactobacillus apisilvae]